MKIGTLEKSHPRKYTENWPEGLTVTSLPHAFPMSSTESSQELATGPPVLTADEGHREEAAAGVLRTAGCQAL